MSADFVSFTSVLPLLQTESWFPKLCLPSHNMGESGTTLTPEWTHHWLARSRDGCDPGGPVRLECAGPLSQTIRRGWGGGVGNKREDDTEESGNQRPFPGDTLWVLDLAVPEAGLAPKGFSQVSQYIYLFMVSAACHQKSPTNSRS